MMKWLESLIYRPLNSPFKFIDGIRAVSSLWLFFFHITVGWEPFSRCFLNDINPLMWLINSGDQLVDGFLMISGFFSGLKQF